MDTEKYLIAHLSRSKNKQPMLFMYFTLPNGVCYLGGQQNLDESEVKKQDFFENELDEYKGHITKKELYTAISNKCNIILFGMFYFDDVREPIIDYAKQHNMTCIAIIDTSPFYTCFPVSNGSLDDLTYNDYIDYYCEAKKSLSMPLPMEGFDQVKLFTDGMEECFGEYFSLNNYIQRSCELFYSNPEDYENRNPIIFGTLAARYAIKEGASSLEMLMCFLSFVGMETMGNGIRKDTPENNKIPTDGYQNISCIDFYSYIHSLIDVLEQVGYKEKDIIECMYAINYYNQHSLKYFDDNNFFQNTSTFRDKVILLKKANTYAANIIKKKTSILDKGDTISKFVEDFLVTLSSKMNEEKQENLGF